VRLYFDENFPTSDQELAAKRGIEWFDHRGSEHEGIDDARLFALAQAEEAILVTTDRDFYHTIPVLHPEHCGILVIALKQPNRERILKRLEWALESSRNTSSRIERSR
jgi:predicted nuclease of predicted toxin-antitoxin system